jgi:hypothetical protein
MQARERSTTLCSRGNDDLVAKIVLDLNILKGTEPLLTGTPRFDTQPQIRMRHPS